MRTHIYLPLAVALTLAVPGSLASRRAQTQPANNFFDSGNDLLAACQSDRDVFLLARCDGFIEGVVRGYEVATNDNPSVLAGDNARLCASGVTKGQVKDVVLNFLRSHPEVRHESSAVLTVRAVLDAWACRVDRKAH